MFEGPMEMRRQRLQLHARLERVRGFPASADNLVDLLFQIDQRFHAAKEAITPIDPAQYRFSVLNRNKTPAAIAELYPFKGVGGGGRAAPWRQG